MQLIGRSVPAVLVLSLSLLSCASSQTTPSSSGQESTAPTAIPTSSAAVSPTPAASATFVTPIPPAAATPWTGIRWRKLAPDDPLANLRSMLRWQGGYVALGATVATGDTSRTPVWVSTDGATWQGLGPDVLGPATLVIGVGETATGIAAVTLQGGTNQCDGEDTPSCWAATLPVQSWTSPDGTTWTAHPGPDIGLRGTCDGCGVNVPIFRAGSPGLLVTNREGGTEQSSAVAAFSADGITWETLPSNAFPARFEFGDIAGFRSGFVAVGGTAGDPGRAAALSSSDGRLWVRRSLPIAGLDPLGGSVAYGLGVGPEGLIATGSDQVAPGTSLWWSSLDGSAWKRLSDYPPLGVWIGEGEGNGLIANGTLIANGERMVAYRPGQHQAAWTSFDGRSWLRLAISGMRPTSAGDWPQQDLILMPIGLLWLGTDGSFWLGEPLT